MTFDINHRLKIILPVLFTLIFIGMLVAFNKQKPRILVINSHELSESWTSDVNKSMEGVFSKTTYPSIFWHSLGTGNRSNLGDKQKSGILARRIVDRMKPDVLILVDDDAQELVGKYYINIPDIQIVYCGINGNLENYGYDDARNVSGILETLPLPALKDVLPLFLPKKSHSDLKIILMGDTSWSSKWDKERVSEYDWSPLHLIDSVNVGTFDEWKESVLKVSERADILLLSNYHQILKNPGRPELVSSRELIDWTLKNTTLPVVGINGSVVEDGGYFAMTTSPYEQGETAATMALSYVLKRGNHVIPKRNLNARDFLVYMRDEGGNVALLPPIYGSFARAVVKFFKTQKKDI